MVETIWCFDLFVGSDGYVEVRGFVMGEGVMVLIFDQLDDELTMHWILMDEWALMGHCYFGMRGEWFVCGLLGYVYLMDLLDVVHYENGAPVG